MVNALLSYPPMSAREERGIAGPEANGWEVGAGHEQEGGAQVMGGEMGLGDRPWAERRRHVMDGKWDL